MSKVIQGWTDGDMILAPLNKIPCCHKDDKTLAAHIQHLEMFCLDCPTKFEVKKGFDDMLIKICFPVICENVKRNKQK